MFVKLQHNASIEYNQNLGIHCLCPAIHAVELTGTLWFCREDLTASPCTFATCGWDMQREFV